MFLRTLVSESGKVGQPLRAGDGWVANLGPVNFNTVPVIL